MTNPVTLVFSLIIIAAGTQPLKDVSVAYSNCTTRGAHDLDDGRASAESIAQRVADRCETEYRRWVDAIRDQPKPDGLIPSNFAVARQTVIDERTRLGKSN